MSLSQMAGSKVGEIITTGTELDQRVIRTARQSARAERDGNNTLLLALEVDPVPILEVTPERLGGSGAW